MMTFASLDKDFKRPSDGLIMGHYSHYLPPYLHISPSPLDQANKLYCMSINLAKTENNKCNENNHIQPDYSMHSHIS